MAVETGKDTLPLDRETVTARSGADGEPEWLLALRLTALDAFLAGPRVPEALESVPVGRAVETDADGGSVAGGRAMGEARAAYDRLAKAWADHGVTFCSLDVALAEHEDLVRAHLGQGGLDLADPATALHVALMRGGTFLHVPKGLTLDGAPLQSPSTLHGDVAGAFQHTLVVVEEGARIHYLEGCTTPGLDAHPVMAQGVEVVVGRDADVRYTSLESFGKRTRNRNVKSASVGAGGAVTWVSANLGSGATHLAPRTVLRERGASATHLTLTVAGAGQDQHVGALVLHEADATTSRVLGRCLAHGGGRTRFRADVKMAPGVRDVETETDVEALLLDDASHHEAQPTLGTAGADAGVTYRAATRRFGADATFYLRARGLTPDQGRALAVTGFLRPVTTDLPLEYAVEIDRLVGMEVAGELA